MSALDKLGYCLCRAVLTSTELGRLASSLGQPRHAGQRGLLAIEEVKQWALSERFASLLRPYMKNEPRPVRAIFFDKTAETNWLVPWHQDLSIAVAQEADPLENFGPWSMKDGIPHVQPPASFLEQMLTLRLHLDEADADNEALRVIPGTHQQGRLTAEQIKQKKTQIPDYLCCCQAGDVLLMRPLLLHASSKSQSSRRRRVLHLEYACHPLPEPLKWHDSA